MDFSTIIGIDVSKLTLDIHVLPDRQVFKTENDPPGIKRLLCWLENECQVNLSDSLFAFEYTGFYSYQLAVHLQDRGYSFVILPRLELKRSYYQKRIKEGKNKMSTQNIIRNKLIARIFAVVERGTPYVDLMKYAS